MPKEKVALIVDRPNINISVRLYSRSLMIARCQVSIKYYISTRELFFTTIQSVFSPHTPVLREISNINPVWDSEADTFETGNTVMGKQFVLAIGDVTSHGLFVCTNIYPVESHILPKLPISALFWKTRTDFFSPANNIRSKHCFHMQSKHFFIIIFSTYQQYKWGSMFLYVFFFHVPKEWVGGSF